jgi:hypothetical protein
MGMRSSHRLGFGADFVAWGGRGCRGLVANGPSCWRGGGVREVLWAKCSCGMNRKFRCIKYGKTGGIIPVAIREPWKRSGKRQP